MEVRGEFLAKCRLGHPKMGASGATSLVCSTYGGVLLLQEVVPRLPKSLPAERGIAAVGWSKCRSTANSGPTWRWQWLRSSGCSTPAPLKFSTLHSPFGSSDSYLRAFPCLACSYCPHVRVSSQHSAGLTSLFPILLLGSHVKLSRQPEVHGSHAIASVTR